MSDANEMRLDRAYSPAINLFGSDLWFDYFKEDTTAQKRARIAKLAAEIPSPPSDEEPF